MSSLREFRLGLAGAMLLAIFIVAMSASNKSFRSAKDAKEAEAKFRAEP
jgi:hypothetical protein